MANKTYLLRWPLINQTAPVDGEFLLFAALATHIEISDTESMHVGIDIGASKTLVATKYNDNIKTANFKTSADFPKFKADLYRVLSNIGESKSPIKSVAVAAPGVINQGAIKRGGQIAWHEVDLKDELGNLLATDDISVINDAAAGGIFEARAGAGTNYNVVLYVTISTGIGSAILIDGKLHHQFANSEGGQMVIDYKNLSRFESLASGRTFTKTYHHLGSEDNDPQHWREYGQLVGIGLFNMIALIQPDIVTIGGSMGVHFDKYKEHTINQVNSLIDGLYDAPEIAAANEPESAVAYGCLLIAQEGL